MPHVTGRWDSARNGYVAMRVWSKYARDYQADQIPQLVGLAGGGGITRCPPLPRRQFSPDDSQFMTKPVPGVQAQEFWTMTFLIAFGLLALCGMAAFGIAWLLA